MASNVQKIIRKADKAQSSIKFAGLKGKSMPLGLIGGQVKENLDIRSYSFAAKKANKDLQKILDSLDTHDLSKIESANEDFDLNFIRQTRKYYFIAFKVFLIQKRAFESLARFRKENKIDKAVMEKQFGDIIKDIRRQLVEDQQEFNSLEKEALNKAGIRLGLASILKSSSAGGFIERRRERLLSKQAFGDERKVEHLLHKHINEKQLQQVKSKLIEEFRAIRDEIKSINLHMHDSIKLLIEKEQLIKKAAAEHNIPLKDFQDEELVEKRMIALIEHVGNALRIIINQLDGYSKEVA